MPIVPADLEYRLSVTTGPGDSTAQGDPNASFGEFMSTTVVGTSENDLFDDVSGAENAASDVEYRCVFLTNTHATLTLQSAAVWLSAETAGGTDVAIALDSTGVVAGDAVAAQALEIDDEGDSTDVLSGLSFSSPTTFETGLSIGDIAPGETIAVWWRRTANDTAAVNDDGATLSIQGDTAA